MQPSGSLSRRLLLGRRCVTHFGTAPAFLLPDLRQMRTKERYRVLRRGSYHLPMVPRLALRARRVGVNRESVFCWFNANRSFASAHYALFLATCLFAAFLPFALRRPGFFPILCACAFNANCPLPRICLFGDFASTSACSCRLRPCSSARFVSLPGCLITSPCGLPNSVPFLCPFAIHPPAV